MNSKKLLVIVISLISLYIKVVIASTPAYPASIVLMVPPDGFDFNYQTAKSNAYQKPHSELDFRKKAVKEFYLMVDKLRAHGIEVITMYQSKSLPDAVFPNNWFSIDASDNGKLKLILYPMLTPNRQKEVNTKGLISALHEHNISIDSIVDLRNKNGDVLEGTGSMVLDKNNKIIYASLSPRTSRMMLEKTKELLHYSAVVFESSDSQNRPIYHTNVMMSVAQKFSIVCLECIKDTHQRKEVINSLKNTRKLLIPITVTQVAHLCGNTIELHNNKGESILVMSQQAYDNFSKNQLEKINRISKILPVNLETIETVGGGSARCMIAEIL